MNIEVSKLCRIALVAIALVLPFGGARAGIVPTHEIAAHEGIEAQREKVREFMAREEVADKLVELGVAPELAKKRAEALTDEEVMTIAGKVDQLPAGARSWSGTEVLLIVIIILLIAL
jgi:hypothetical protein